MHLHFACSDMQAGSEKAPQVLAEGGSIEPIEPPWLRAWNLPPCKPSPRQYIHVYDVRL